MWSYDPIKLEYIWQGQRKVEVRKEYQFQETESLTVPHTKVTVFVAEIELQKFFHYKALIRSYGLRQFAYSEKVT